MKLITAESCGEYTRNIQPLIITDNIEYRTLYYFYSFFTFFIKKMYNQDKGKIECTVVNRDICFWHGKKAEIGLILFRTSGSAEFICLWLLVMPN